MAVFAKFVVYKSYFNSIVSGEQWNELIFTFTLQQNMQKQFISLIAWGWLECGLN